ncbi:group III truncated hemoglobin [uncultured Cytophaga sp.]|uniref:group III truncated hemoglobin n=1 Tax=uncultured Cytophaga sp. TaxID=160238 RepID=UPI002611EB17|nr:group III truncated hemoglobin [uncultured Cytophaga sp.]
MNAKEIINLADIKLLVDDFYDKVKIDPLLGPVFNGVLKDHWPEHMEKLYRFWQTILLEEHTYHGSPFVPHAQLPIEKKHFDRWIKLFEETVDDHFIGEKATEAKWRANKMAEMFQYRIEQNRENPDKSLFR